MEEQMVAELKRAVGAIEQLVEKMEKQGEMLVEKVEAMAGELGERIGKITAVAEESASARRATEGHGGKKTLSPFVAKILAKAEGDRVKLEEALRPLSIEQRIAVKMGMGKSRE